MRMRHLVLLRRRWIRWHHPNVCRRFLTMMMVMVMVVMCPQMSLFRTMITMIRHVQSYFVLVGIPKPTPSPLPTPTTLPVHPTTQTQTQTQTILSPTTNTTNHNTNHTNRNNNGYNRTVTPLTSGGNGTGTGYALTAAVDALRSRNGPCRMKETGKARYDLGWDAFIQKV